MDFHRIVREDIETVLSAELPWGNFANTTVLISGAAGYLPAYMVETLLHLNDSDPARACKVVALVRNPARARERFSHCLDRVDFEIFEQDVCNRINWKGEADFIIHAASQASPKYYGTDPVGTIAANTLGTHHLLALARDRGAIGFLYFSSSEVYGENYRATALSEDAAGSVDPTQVRSCYAEGKRAGETFCVSYAHQHDVPCRIVRPFHTYGPGMRLDDGRVFADFVANVVRNENIVLKSDGSARRAFCYLSDAVGGFFHVLLKGETAEAYNVANPGGGMSIRELAELLVSLYSEKKLKVEIDQLSKPAGYIASSVSRCLPDITKISNLGWMPVVSVSDGFRRTVQSYL